MPEASTLHEAVPHLSIGPLVTEVTQPMIWHRALTDTIFGTDIQLIVCTIPEIRQWIAEHPEFEDADSDEDWESANAETLQTSHGPARWLVWLPPHRVSCADPEQLGTLVHECVHVTLQVLSDRGVILCDESEEVFAYYTSAVFLQLLLALKTYRPSSKKTVTRRAASKGSR